MTPTPETLHKLGDEAASRKLSPMEVHAAAAAWEADVSDVCTINVELNLTIIRLSKRLEAAERYLRLIGHGEDWAALAGEE